MSKKIPLLKGISAAAAPFELNEFTKDFAFNIAKEIVYLLATKSQVSLEGSDWEQIFAKSIGADWKPSTVGLNDVVLGNTAWGAKTVKALNVENLKRVRLISGRNSPSYSFDTDESIRTNPNAIGSMVLDIWNERVSHVRALYKNLRTVVLVKTNDLSQVLIFEYNTNLFMPEKYEWIVNSRRNLEGYDLLTKKHKFTWQPHGSQFTIIEDVPDNSLLLDIRVPDKVSKEDILNAVGFDTSWVTARRI